MDASYRRNTCASTHFLVDLLAVGGFALVLYDYPHRVCFQGTNPGVAGLLT